MRHFMIAAALLVAVGCKPKPRPDLPPDSSAVDTVVRDSVPSDTAALDSGDSLYWYEQRQQPSMRSGRPKRPHPSTADTATSAPAMTLAVSVSYTGRMFGPNGLWATWTDVLYGPAPFTGSKNFTAASGLVTQIQAARAMKHRLMLTMTGGPHSRYSTNGRFDIKKWRATMATYYTASIKSALAAAVADGTVIGNVMVDEPEHISWGRNPDAFSKPLIDQMASEIRAVFPTLPLGINIGPPSYKWHASETYKQLDFVIYQYNNYITNGNIVAWRDLVKAQAAKDNVVPGFSLNILDGGVQDRDGHYGCNGSGQAGLGTYYPNCRMPSSMVLSYGQALAPSGCMLMFWMFNRDFIVNALSAMKTLATLNAGLSPMACKK